MRDYGFNDCISSWVCGKSISYDFCHDPWNGSYCTYHKGHFGAGSARNPDMQGDDTTMMVMRNYDVATQGAALLF